MRALVLGLVLAGFPRHGFASPTHVATLRHSIELHVDQAPKHRLTKTQLRPPLKKVMRLVHRCYDAAVSSDPKISGVVNVGLTIRNDPALGISLTVTGFDTNGALGDSQSFLACVKTTLESNVLPPLPRLGSTDIFYPLTFDPGGGAHPDDKAIVDDAVHAARRGHCADALDGAERGLERTWMSRPLRHRLIEVAGTCACQLKNEAKARHYDALASPEFEDAIVRACAAADIRLP